MDNTCTIMNDSENVYLSLRVHGNKIGIIFLSFFTIAILIISCFLISEIDPKETGIMALIFLLGIILFNAIPIKYLLWNIYGIESIAINSKCISYDYDYKIYKTKIQTIAFEKLELVFESVNVDPEKNTGRIIFIDYDKETNLPIEIFRTTTLLQLEDIKEINNELLNLFNNKYLEQNGYIGFSDN